MEIERDELQQLVVLHLGQQHLGAALEQILRQLPLRVNQLVDLLLDRPAADELVHQHVLGLADAKRAIGRLILDRRIPPAIEMHDVRGGGEVEPGAAGLEREDEERHAPRPPETAAPAPAASSTAVPPCRTSPGRPNTDPRNAASGAVISRNCVKTSTFSCFAAITSAISRSRASLPLSASLHEPSPSHCDG